MSRRQLSALLMEFQSAPPTEVRGDIKVKRAGRKEIDVSIRSPHRSEGRFAKQFTGALAELGFNPLPPPK